METSTQLQKAIPEQGIEKTKRHFLDFAKTLLFREVEKVKLNKNDKLLMMFEEGRISRDEYLLLLSSTDTTTVNLTLDHSINANGGTWGGRIVMGDNNGSERF